MEGTIFEDIPLRPDNVFQELGEGVRKHGVGHESVFEKGAGADTLGAINDLGRQDEITGGEFFTKGTDGGEGEDGLDTEGFQGGHVGTGGDLGRGEVMTTAVAGQEGDVGTVSGAGNGDGIAGLSPGLWFFLKRKEIIKKVRSRQKKETIGNNEYYVDDEVRFWTSIEGRGEGGRQNKQ